jgi:hypothetical protein
MLKRDQYFKDSAGAPCIRFNGLAGLAGVPG